MEATFEKEHVISSKCWQQSKWALVLALLLGAVPAYLVPFYFSSADSSTGLEPYGVLYYTIFWGGAMSLILLLLLWFLNGERPRDLNLAQGAWWKDILMGLGLMVVTLGVFMLTRNLIYGLFPPPQGPGADPLFEELINNPRFFVLMTGPGLLIGAGIYEELTRVFLLSRLWKIWDNGAWRWAILILSAVIFGVMHAYQGPAGMVSTGISGLLMGVFYLRFGRVLPMFIAHYLHDAVQFTAAYIMFH